MKIHDVVQGSPEWQALRASYFCASEAPAMMGASTKMSRTELLRLKSSGDEREFSDWVQKNLLDKGHETEASARTIIEAKLGEELYPTTASDDNDNLLASYDGITIAGDTGFEHKMWNEELAAAVRNKELPPAYFWQLEQQILIAGLRRVIFVVSDGTAEKMVRMQYFPVEGRAAQLLAGWKQFAEDVKNYVHVESLPSPAGKAIMALPHLTVQLVGEVKESNLVAFKQSALTFIHAINTDLQSDQDFADAEKTIKFCGEAEDNLDSVKRSALSQTASIDELFRTIDVLSEEMRGKRLELEKLVKARKDSIRVEIRTEGINASTTHLAALNARLGGSYMPTVPSDFTGVMKGKKTITSLRDAINTELARFKIEANAIADRIDANLKTLADLGKDHGFLFSDKNAIVQKASDDLTALVKLRIAEHEKKEAERLEADRERIRKEELAKIEAKRVADEKAEADRLAAEAVVVVEPEPIPAAVEVKAAPATVGTIGHVSHNAPVNTSPAFPILPSTRNVRFVPTQRPPDETLVHLIAATYHASPVEVLQWLREIDHDSLSRKFEAVA